MSKLTFVKRVDLEINELYIWTQYGSSPWHTQDNKFAAYWNGNEFIISPDLEKDLLNRASKSGFNLSTLNYDKDIKRIILRSVKKNTVYSIEEGSGTST